MSISSEARARMSEAWDARYKHGKAARTWDAVANEKPEGRALYLILAKWMAAYEAADAEAEREFLALASEVEP